MIIQDIYLKRIEWHLRIYYAVTRYYADEIIDDLIRVGCDGSNLKEAEKHLWEGNANTGLTYSNLDTHETVMVIGFANSPSEYYNSISHEQMHALAHIAQSYGLNPYGEDVCYIMGEMAMSMYSHVKILLCENCYKKYMLGDKKGFRPIASRKPRPIK